MTEEAILQFRKAINFDLGLPSAYTNLGVVYWRIELTNQAIEQYRIAIELRPDIADPYNNLGIIYAGLGLLDKARGISSLP
jgi:Flp pilus assembly protein TadD